MNAHEKRDTQKARRIANVMHRHGFVEKKVVRVTLLDKTLRSVKCWVKDANQASFTEDSKDLGAKIDGHLF
jgi:hypothetical protein